MAPAWRRTRVMGRPGHPDDPARGLEPRLDAPPIPGVRLGRGVAGQGEQAPHPGGEGEDGTAQERFRVRPQRLHGDGGGGLAQADGGAGVPVTSRRRTPSSSATDSSCRAAQGGTGQSSWKGSPYPAMPASTRRRLRRPSWPEACPGGAGTGRVRNWPRVSTFPSPGPLPPGEGPVGTGIREPVPGGQIHEGPVRGPVVPVPGGTEVGQDPGDRFLPERTEGEHQQSRFGPGRGAAEVHPHPEGPSSAAHGRGEGAQARCGARVADPRLRPLREALPPLIQQRPVAFLASLGGIDARQAGHLHHQGERPALHDRLPDGLDPHRHPGAGRHSAAQGQAPCDPHQPRQEPVGRRRFPGAPHRCSLMKPVPQAPFRNPFGKTSCAPGCIVAYPSCRQPSPPAWRPRPRRRSRRTSTSSGSSISTPAAAPRGPR